jgi:hypothetical protein
MPLLWLQSTEFYQWWMSDASRTTAEKAYAHAILDALYADTASYGAAA